MLGFSKKEEKELRDRNRKREWIGIGNTRRREDIEDAKAAEKRRKLERQRAEAKLRADIASEKARKVVAQKKKIHAMFGGKKKKRSSTDW